MTYDLVLNTPELPHVGDEYDPTCLTGAVDIDSYAIERIFYQGKIWIVLCFNRAESRAWKVVAVIPEGQGRHIARWLIEAYL